MPGAADAHQAGPVIVDLRRMIPPERHATVFAALETLGPGGVFVLINDHAPLPLVRRIEERWPDRFAVEFLRNGPDIWQVAIARAAA